MYAFLLLCFVHPVAHSTSTKKKLPYQVNLSKRNIPTSSSWRLLFIRRRKSFSFDGVKFINLIACWYLYYNGSWDNSFFWGHQPIIKKESFNEIPCLHPSSLMIFFFRKLASLLHSDSSWRSGWKKCHLKNMHHNLHSKMLTTTKLQVRNWNHAAMVVVDGKMKSFFKLNPRRFASSCEKC